MSSKIKSSTAFKINWPCEKVVPSKKCEARVIQTLHRTGEWGRGRDLPPHRLDEIQDACNNNSMSLYQALSLRRTLLRSFPNGMQKVSRSSQMGTNSGQREIATIFEDAVVEFVSSSLAAQTNKKIFKTEAELVKEMKNGTRERGPTPDILFLHPVSINGRLVKWIDAKMYYASASFAHNKKLPNGKLSSMAQRYISHFGGQGAFVFGQSFCADLQDIVSHALLLDATPLDMTAVCEFQNASMKLE